MQRATEHNVLWVNWQIIIMFNGRAQIYIHWYCHVCFWALCKLWFVYRWPTANHMTGNTVTHTDICFSLVVHKTSNVLHHNPKTKPYTKCPVIDMFSIFARTFCTQKESGETGLAALPTILIHCDTTIIPCSTSPKSNFRGWRTFLI